MTGAEVKDLLTVLKPRKYNMSLFDVTWYADMLWALETEMVLSYYSKDSYLDQWSQTQQSFL